MVSNVPHKLASQITDAEPLLSQYISVLRLQAYSVS